MAKKIAAVIGAGPAGLTAAFELLKQTDIHPLVFEACPEVGGISKTKVYKGNRIDFGGHRFFSKNNRIMDWWQSILPLQGAPAMDQPASGDIEFAFASNGPDPEQTDKVLLIRNRLSRILFLGKLFPYPISIGIKTFRYLGPVRTFKILCSYIKSTLFPIRNEQNLEDFFINRFGRQLYSLFFRDYTEKVWGVPCNRIPADWGKQRIKGLSVRSLLAHAFTQHRKNRDSLNQKDVETSLINRFLYPKFGPGQMWETVAESVVDMGGEIRLNTEVCSIQCRDDHVRAVTVRNLETGEKETLEVDYLFSTMPVRNLVEAFETPVPEEAKQIAAGLMYRDFITVGLLLNRLQLFDDNGTTKAPLSISDTWIYVQEPDVLLGRIQFFNNWSPYLVQDPTTVWIGLEYFCNEGDSFWNKEDKEILKTAVEELVHIGAVDTADVVDGVVYRMPKAYPSYFGKYNDFNKVRSFLDGIPNLFLIGRNGMHRYNNMDHSMLTAMTAVENIKNNIFTKHNIWEINTEQQYHEEKH